MVKAFSELEDPNVFCDTVCAAFSASPSEISGMIDSTATVDRERAAYAHDEYMQSIRRFALYLDSGDPDHYKRAGALLHALATSTIITGVNLAPSADELESGFTQMTLGDAMHYLPFVQFYDEFHNQLAAFEFAYRICAIYEENPKTPSMDYIYNFCRYLKCEPNLSVDTCFMLFKSLMI